MDHTSSLFFALAAVAVGLLMLIGGGESLVFGATRLARRFGIPTFVIGLTVVAFGTSVPELFISVTASLQGHPDIMLGNVIGSNIANVGLILGCCALISPLHMQLKEVWTELVIVLAASVVLMFCSGFGVFPRVIGLLFIISLLGYTYYTYTSQRNGNNTNSQSNQPMRTDLANVLIILAGLILLGVGSTVFIQGAVSTARFFEISELVIGLTLAAIGTSLPELASSIAALRQKETDLLVGNVIGSNMFNLLMVLGITGLIKPFTIQPELLLRDLPIMFLFSAILVPIFYHRGKAGKRHGFLLLAGYGAYCYHLL